MASPHDCGLEGGSDRSKRDRFVDLGLLEGGRGSRRTTLSLAVSASILHCGGPPRRRRRGDAADAEGQPSPRTSPTTSVCPFTTDAPTAASCEAAPADFQARAANDIDDTGRRPSPADRCQSGAVRARVIPFAASAVARQGPGKPPPNPLAIAMMSGWPPIRTQTAGWSG
jgi:hypothetical protein